MSLSIVQGDRVPRYLRARRGLAPALLPLLVLGVLACAGTRRSAETYRDGNMDFGQIQRVAVLPLANLSPVSQAGERVRDVFTNMLQAGGSLYVLPPGEVARGLSRTRPANPQALTGDEAVALGKEIKADVVIAGTVREYGDVRSGNTTANAISLSLQMIETQTGRIVWSGSSTQGGISAGDRLLGGRGRPMNVVTEQAVEDLINQLFEGR